MRPSREHACSTANNELFPDPFAPVTATHTKKNLSVSTFDTYYYEALTHTWHP
jgi:hypothetical protein